MTEKNGYGHNPQMPLQQAAQSSDGPPSPNPGSLQIKSQLWLQLAENEMGSLTDEEKNLLKDLLQKGVNFDQALSLIREGRAKKQVPLKAPSAKPIDPDFKFQLWLKLAKLELGTLTEKEEKLLKVLCRKGRKLDVALNRIREIRAEKQKIREPSGSSQGLG